MSVEAMVEVIERVATDAAEGLRARSDHDSDAAGIQSGLVLM